MPEIGEHVFYLERPNGHPEKGFIVGSSSRSWFISSSQNPWWAGDITSLRKHGIRYEKKEITFVTEEVYTLGRWATNNRGKIQREIWNITPEQMEPCAKCRLPRHEHEKTYGLIPDHKFMETKATGG